MICEICKKVCERTSNRQKYCINCRKTKRKEWDKNRNKTHRRRTWWLKYYKEKREWKRKRDRNWYQKNKEKLKQYQKNYRKRNQEKIHMQRYAWRFLREKMLERANYKCELCGENQNLQLHHKEYTQYNKKAYREIDMKKIMVVCPSCHRLLHRRPEALFLKKRLK